MKNQNQKAFVFDTELRLIALTGITARSLVELRQALAKVPESSIFFHTHQKYLAHNFQKLTYYNDFSIWVSHVLREEALAEKLAAIDLRAFATIRELREAIGQTIDDYQAGLSRSTHVCRQEEAFCFCRSKNFILPTGLVARDVPDFFAKLPQITNASLYFHFFEARLRLKRRTSDFSRWLRNRGRDDLARAIDELNPYIQTLDKLKQDIIRLGANLQ